MTTSARAAKPVMQPAEEPLARGGARFEMIARLAVLHDEAAETAGLARLLGRATTAALALGLSASVVAANWHGPLVPLFAWLFLLGAGMAAVFRVYDNSVASPIDLVQMRARSADLSAVMLYVGFAWGAGSFLALAADASLGGRLIFAAGAGALVTVALRNVVFSACFLLPATVLATAAALQQSGERRLLDGAAVLGSCVVVGLAGLVFERLFLRMRSRNMAPYSPN